MADAAGVITRPSLGRKAAMGQLYDARTDRFFHDSCFPDASSSPKTHPEPIKVIHITRGSTLSEKLSTPLLSGDSKLSLLSKMITPIGSSAYLLEDSFDQPGLNAILNYSVVTQEDTRQILLDRSILESVNVETITASTEATHVVTGITYGGSATLVIDYKFGENDDYHIYFERNLTKLEACLRGTSTGADFVDDVNIFMKFYSDFCDRVQFPKKFYLGLILLQNLESTLCKNKGKCVPLMYTLCSIETIFGSLGISEEIDRDVQYFSTGQVDEIVKLFDELKETKTEVDLRNELRQFVYRYRSGTSQCNFEVQLRQLKGILHTNDSEVQILTTSFSKMQTMLQNETVKPKKSLDITLSDRQTQLKSTISSSQHSHQTDEVPILETMSSIPELNILLLGQTGVGKSTWINAMVNYLQYAKLSEAKKGELRCLVPSQFTIYDSDKEITVRVGSDDKNEELGAGLSATKSCRVHTFHDEGKILRFIDTPGICDTSGLEKDKENVANILSCLSQFEVLHGICILLKPNESRLTHNLRYCVLELLTHLHRDAAKNLAFCCTNSRGTSYRPGDTFTSLRPLIQEIKGVDIPLNTDTIYCVDNEAFRYLMTWRQGVAHLYGNETAFDESWNHSVNEIRRLISNLEKRTPHNIRSTQSLNNAKTIIGNLIKPLAEVTRNNQRNIQLLQDYQKKLEKTTQNMIQLANKLYMPQTVLNARELDQPRTVCTSKKCIQDKIRRVGSMQKYDYGKGTACHENCQLLDVHTEQIGHPALQFCQAIVANKSKQCQKCGCSWQFHAHITYVVESETKNVENEDVREKIVTEKEAKKKIDEQIRRLVVKVQELKEEHETIMKVCAQFSIFLNENSIVPYNDALGDYLSYLIRQENEKAIETGQRETLERLQDCLREYQQQVEIMKSLNENPEVEKLTPEGMHEKIQELYGLQHMGKKLKELMTVANAAHAKYQQQHRNKYSSVIRNRRRVL